MSEPQARRQFGLNNFDLLRILAATQVLYFHTIFHLKIDAPSWTLVFQYFPGVPIFFVISGYLVSASYERSESLMRYFWNRPAAMFTVIATMAVLKKNDSAPCATTMRRTGFSVTATSETWNVMPTTKEKYTKSQ